MEYLPRVKNGKLFIRPKRQKRYKAHKLVVRLAPSKAKKRRRKNHQKRRDLPSVPKRYAEYITSVHWKLVKQSYFRRHRKACGVCDTRQNVDLHHMIYGVWGQEKDHHLVPLCRFHHTKFHDKIGVKGNMLKETHQFIIEEQELLEL